ncbi:MAG: Maf family protein [Pseudomonadota bacterium]|nr:Maf family protein [Pseudomonadota bacterium]
MKKRIILASSSIHRKKLLHQLKINFLSVSPNINEKKLKNETVTSFVKRLSKEKAMAVSKKYKDALIIGSDEIALVNNKILGKPITNKIARRQLKFISNKIVVFKTGLCMLDTQTNKSLTTIVNYKVHMKKLTTKQINHYIKNEDMLNCAASIRIEGMGITLVKKMHGPDPSSIIGLPLIKVVEFLKFFGYANFKK